MSREKTITIRNTSRRKLFFAIKPEIAKRAQNEKIDGMHRSEPVFVLGDCDAHVELETSPEAQIPAWLWDAVKSFAATQGKAVKGWMADGTLIEYNA